MYPVLNSKVLIGCIFFDGIANKKSPAFLPKTFKVLGEKAGGFCLKHLKFLAENVRSFLS